MNKKIMIVFFFFIFLICFWWIINFVIHEGDFAKLGHAAISKEHFVDGTPIYLGYPFKWEGIGNPTLEKVEFIKRDGTIVTEDDDEIRIQPYISRTDTIGALSEESVKQEGLDNDLLQVKGFKVNGDFNLILRVGVSGAHTNNDIHTLRVTYKKFGVTQVQDVPFGDGVISTW